MSTTEVVRPQLSETLFLNEIKATGSNYSHYSTGKQSHYPADNKMITGVNTVREKNTK